MFILWWRWGYWCLRVYLGLSACLPSTLILSTMTFTSYQLSHYSISCLARLTSQRPSWSAEGPWCDNRLRIGDLPRCWRSYFCHHPTSLIVFFFLRKTLPGWYQFSSVSGDVNYRDRVFVLEPAEPVNVWYIWIYIAASSICQSTRTTIGVSSLKVTYDG